VDIVENRDCFYYDYFVDFTPPSGAITPYSGSWTPTMWRAEATKAITNCFGSGDVDSSGSIALVIDEKSAAARARTSCPATCTTGTTTRTGASFQGGKVFK
jgi:hypothetical protein